VGTSSNLIETGLKPVGGRPRPQKTEITVLQVFYGKQAYWQAGIKGVCRTVEKGLKTRVFLEILRNNGNKTRK